MKHTNISRAEAHMLYDEHMRIAGNLELYYMKKETRKLPVSKQEYLTSIADILDETAAQTFSLFSMNINIYKKCNIYSNGHMIFPRDKESIMMLDVMNTSSKFLFIDVCEESMYIGNKLDKITGRLDIIKGIHKISFEPMIGALGINLVSEQYDKMNNSKPLLTCNGIPAREVKVSLSGGGPGDAGAVIIDLDKREYIALLTDGTDIVKSETASIQMAIYDMGD